VKIKLTVLLLVLTAALHAGAAGLTASLLYKIETVGIGMPADVVLEDSKRFGIYDAFDGKYTTYLNGSPVNVQTKEFLKNGNCLVKNGNYFLFCNSTEKRVDMLSENLRKYSFFTVSEDMKGAYDPTDVLVSDGFLYSADNDNHRVVKTDMTTGEVVQSIGGFGEGRLFFWYPYALAVDKKDVLYVSEVLNTRVQKITKELKFYEFIGKWGVKPAEFYRPTGIAVFNGENLIVADGFTGFIQTLDTDGNFTGVLKNESGQKLKFGSVTHIRVKGNLLAVVDAFNKTVYIFELKEQK